MKDELIDFNRCFGKRRARHKKKIFIDNTVNALSPLGIKATVAAARVGPLAVKNVYLGDVATAAIVVAAGYDTSERALLARGYRPLETDYNRRTQLYEMLIRLAASLLAIAAVYPLFRYGLAAHGLIGAASIAASFGLLVLALAMARGFDNTTTFGKSTSLFTLLQLAQKHGTAEAAYALVDYGSYSRIGLDRLKADIGAETTVVYLDALAVGDRLLIATRGRGAAIGRAMAQAAGTQAVVVGYDEPAGRFAMFDDFVLVSAVDEQAGHYAIRNARTEHDLSFDPELVERMPDILQAGLFRPIIKNGRMKKGGKAAGSTAETKDDGKR